MDTKYKIGILYICTGSYVQFWKDFYISFEKYFLNNSCIEYFVFTDAEKIYGEAGNQRIHKLFQSDLGWPDNTLFRFKMFKRIAEDLKQFDYIFFMNSNIVCTKSVTEEMFLPLKENLLVVQHPGWYGNKPYEYPYDRQKKSNAYIPRYKGDIYVCGGVNGGKTNEFLKLINELDSKIQEDYDKGIIAKWHDESHINKYILERNDYKVLSPSYCYPEDWDIPYETIFLLRDKKKVIDIKFKEDKGKRKKWHFIIRIINDVYMLIWKVIYFFMKKG